MKPFKTEKIDIYKNIKEHSLKDGIPVVKETTGKLLFTFALIELPQRILEIGTGYGYTALILSETLHKNGIIDSIELKEKNFLTAKKNIEKMNKSKEIQSDFR
jgi:predicted O-methyltransferase YrrM